MTEQVVANAHFLYPIPPAPPQVNPSWLCYPVLMSVRSPLLPRSALFLTASQTHAVTQPHSACLLTVQPLGPSAFELTRRSSIPSHQSAAYGRPACREESLMSRHTSPTHFSKHSELPVQHLVLITRERQPWFPTEPPRPPPFPEKHNG